MTEDVLVPGARDVRGSLSSPDARACIVACPPHPQHGGSRADARLRAVADALGERHIACLLFDYGPWDSGRGERIDAGNAIVWARENYGRVGLFGYSFGAAVALLAAAGRSSVADDEPLCAVSVLAPPARIDSLDPVEAVDRIDAPLQVLYGDRDDAVGWETVVGAARRGGADVVGLPADHSFVGTRERIGRTVAAFVDERC